MTAAMLEKANDELRAAVRARLDATDPSDDKLVGYRPGPLAGCEPAQQCAAEVLSRESCCQGTPQHTTLGYDAKTMRDARDFIAARDEFESFRGDSLMREPRAAGSPEWLDALDRLRALHHEKTAQYGGADDAFENVTASAKCGVEPWRRALCDLSDCVVRMQKYAQGQPVDPTNALLDAANWALICLIKMEEAGRSTTGPIPIM
jgi:hypothetical protein